MIHEANRMYSYLRLIDSKKAIEKKKSENFNINV